MIQRHARVDYESMYALLGDDARLSDAFDIADMAHAGQLRSTAAGKVPYIIHPLWVFFCLRSWGVTDMVCLTAALLHDTVEDAPDKVWKFTASPFRDYSTPDTPRERALLGLDQRFGPEVSSVVDGLSNQPDVGYIEHASEATKDSRVLVVKLADATHNALNLDPLHPRYEKLLARYAPLLPLLATRLAEDEEAQRLIPEWKSVLATFV